MHPKHEEAKHLFKTKRYQEAKEVILQIIATNKHGDNSKYLCKLGDICCQFLDFKNAQTYYQQSLNENPQNPSALLKLASILSTHLNKTKQAISIYQKCLQISPNSTECLFKYAKLMEHEHYYQKAKQLYVKCLQIDDSKASVHYHYAKLLMKHQEHNYHNKNIEYLLQKACKLKPKIGKYHYEYALFLQKNQQIKKANKQWEIAIDLSNNEDMILLHKFGKFNLQHKNDKRKALKCYQIAADIQSNISDSDAKTSYSFITDNYLELKQSIDDKKNKNNKNDIRLVIYEFDEIICYWNLYEFINRNQCEWNKIASFELYKIFGGYDRINRLCIHFETIFKQQQQQTPSGDNDNDNNRIKIALLSHNEPCIVIEILKRVKLYHFFANALIICSETTKRKRNKYLDVIKIKKKYKIFNNFNVLLIDTYNNEQQHKQLIRECHLFYPAKCRNNNNKILRGLSFHDFDHIECIINNEKYISNNTNTIINKYDNYHQILNINNEIYNDLRGEIITMNMNDTIQCLPCIKWLTNNTNINLRSDSKIFIQFAQKLRKIIIFMRNSDIWSAAQYLSELVALVDNDIFLCCRYAKCLSYLRHIEAADYYFNCNTKDNISALIGYGYHLLSIRYYAKAYYQFNKCLSQGAKPNCKLYVGLARSAQHLNKYELCQEWYLRAIEIEKHETNWFNGFYEAAHIHFAKFLNVTNRLDEAIYHLSLCIKHNPCSHSAAIIHYKMAQIYMKLGKLNKYERHLGKTLEIDPYLVRAREDYMYYYNQSYVTDVFYQNIEIENKKNSNENNIKYENEFDRFWFDKLSISKYKIYFEQIIKDKKNDIRCLLFDQQIDEIVQNNKVIMEKIIFYRLEYERFIQWLKQYQLFASFYPIFNRNAIYTMESLQRNVKDKQGLERMIGEYYNKNNSDGCARDECFQLIDTLWGAKNNYNY